MPFLNLHELEEKELIFGFKGPIVHSENMAFAYWDIGAGAYGPSTFMRMNRLSPL